MKITKRLFAVLLTLVLLCVGVPFEVSAATDVDSGTCGENLTWLLDSDGKLTIYGTGSMNSYNSNSYNGKFATSAPWGQYYKQIKTIIIGDCVTSIGSYAFYGCSSLTSVTIPDGLTSISVYVFFDCTGLISVKIPDSVSSIGNYAFIECSSLTSVTIPDGVTSIGDGVFKYCHSLTSVTIPDSVTSIGTAAFSYCYSLISLTIPDSVTSIGWFAFYNCTSLTSVTIPDGVTSIAPCAFNNCTSLANVTIGNGVTDIGADAFSGCRSLTSVTIPNSVTSIGTYVFISCTSLTSVTIPYSVTSIGEGAFKYCLADMVIFGYSGSCAHTYAEENGFIFSVIDDIPYVTLHTQQNTNTPQFSAHGVANRYAEVCIYDDETLLDTVLADANGHWSGNFTLANLEDPSDHTITAVVTKDGEPVTVTDNVSYDSNAFYPVDFTLTHIGTMIDLLQVRHVNLSVLSSSLMTFNVKLNRAVTNLALTSTKGSEVKTMNATFDAATGTWTAQGWFDPKNHSYVPGELGIRVNGSEDLAFETANISYLIDPSGYVYEAVKSNRVEGASALIFYRDSEGHPMLWDANQYEQDNPQTTDSMGVYHWDVTEGAWRVKVVKGGYEPAYSDWMDVPPEWTEVAIPLVTNNAPTVETVEKSEDSYVISFSQYMDITSVNSTNVVFSVSGSTVAGTLTALNAEVSGTNNSVEYASEFKFVPNVEPQGKLDLTISNVANYAGIGLEEDYTAENLNKSEHVHTYTSSVTTQPTCTKPGVRTFTCTSCAAGTEGHAYTEKINALGHAYVNHAAKEPTCEEPGWDAYQTCSRCSYTTFAEKEALGHIAEDEDGYRDREDGGKPREGADLCPQCGKVHKGFFQKIIGFFHKIIYNLTHLFKKDDASAKTNSKK